MFITIGDGYTLNFGKRRGNVAIEPFHLATSLSRINRWNGHGSTTISVARHSINVACGLEGSARIHGLLHDAAECAVGDIVEPLARYLGPAWSDPVKKTEGQVLEGIYDSLGIERPTLEQSRMVKRHDQEWMLREYLVLFGETVFRTVFSERMPEIPDGAFPNASPEDTRDEFLEILSNLRGESWG